MRDDLTVRTTRGINLENFAKLALQTPLALLAKGDVNGAVQRLRDFITSQKMSFGNAIDRVILPRLRERDKQMGVVQQSDADLTARARDRLIRDFDPLLMGALALDQPGFFEQVLGCMSEVPALGIERFRKTEAHLLPLNPIAHLWAVLIAYRTGRPVHDVLVQDDSLASRYVQQIARAAEFLKALKQLTESSRPGYSKVQALVMQKGEVSTSAPLPSSVAEAPTQTMIVRRIEMDFVGEEEVTALQVLEAAAIKYGGLKNFWLLIAKNLVEQQKNKK